MRTSRFNRVLKVLSLGMIVIPSAFGDTSLSHLTFDVDPAITYKIEKIEKNKQISALKLTLKGVPARWNLKAPLTSDARTAKVASRKVSVDTVEYVFTMKKGNIEYFDYRSKVPSQIVLDYWFKDSAVPSKQKPVAGAGSKKTVSQTIRKGSSKRKAPSVVAKKSTRPAPKSILVKPAEDVGCATPLVPEKDGIIYWNTFHRDFPYKKFFKMDLPDTDYVYPQKTAAHGEHLGTEKDEVLHYRLAHKLYADRELGLTLKTISFFEEQYPLSKLTPDIQFLKASVLVVLSRRLQASRYLKMALETLKSLVVDAPDTDRGKRSLAYIFQESMGLIPPAEALELSIIGAELKGYEAGDITPWVYRFASAEALFAMGEQDRANRTYQLILDQENALSALAAVRLGEVFSARKLWERAIFSYERAIRLYPKVADTYAPLWVNLAEAYFRLSKNSDAERFYRQFVEKFPKDDVVWAGKLRLAEFEQMKLTRAEPGKREFIRGLYEKVVNENPYTPGEVLAHLRLAVCGHNPEYFSDFFASRNVLEKEHRFESVLIEPRQKDLWMDLAESKFYLWSGDFRKVLKFADKYGDQLGAMSMGDSFKIVISTALTGMVKQISTDSKSVNAEKLLREIEAYHAYAPNPEPFGYTLSIARALQEMSDLEGVGKKLKILEKNLATASDLEQDWYHYVRAKHLRTLGLSFESVISELNTIRDSSPLAIEKFDGISEAALANGDLELSVEKDDLILKRFSNITADRGIKVSLRQAENLWKKNDLASVVQRADHAYLRFGAYFNDHKKSLTRMRELRALSLYELKRFNEAALAFEELQKKYDIKNAEYEFKHAKALVASGKKKEGLEAFRGLARVDSGANAGSEADVWKKSAQAELDNQQWEEGIQKSLTNKKTGGL